MGFISLIESIEMMNLKGSCLEDDFFAPIGLSLLHFHAYIEALDLGENPLLTDRIAAKYIL
jgi:hypothetical protein